MRPREQYLITDISVMKVCDNPFSYEAPRNAEVFSAVKPPSIDDTFEVHRQIIRLEEFYHPEEGNIVVGMTEEVEKFLGLPMSCYLDMRAEINLLEKQKALAIKVSGDFRKKVKTFWGYIKHRWNQRTFLVKLI